MPHTELSLHSVSTSEDKKQHENQQDLGRTVSADAWPPPISEPIEQEDHHGYVVEQDESTRTDTVKDQSGLSKAVSARSNALSRTLSSRSAATSYRDPGPPPDGGIHAWSQAIAVHLSIFSTWGLISGFGVFQTYYTETLNIDPSTVSWIGSIQVFLLFFVGTFSGRANDAGLFRPVFITGNVLQLIGIFATSASTKLYQLFLAQALCIGLGNGLQFCPAMSLLSTYFARKRNFAIGIAALGSCTGGIVFPVVIQQLLPRIGFPWAIRVCGFIMVATSAVSIAILKPRLPPRKSGPLVELSAFKELPYSLYCLGMFFNFWGIYYAFYYVGSYGRNVLGISYQDSINLLLTMVAVGFFFRAIPNYYADTFGPLNMIIPFAFVCGIMMFGWIGVKSRASLFVFASIYGCGSAGMQGLFVATLSSLTTDLSKAGIRMGMGFTIVSIGCLTGPPIAGAIIQSSGGSYVYADIWAGLCFIIGGSTLIAARIAKAGWRLSARI
ncbi:MFS monocarboxylate transporter-like protein [Polychaeton citri CBS 116435]|uniref:MFS monocarboxylate transporter-like protein n=1 Tax=Polychaeton citri CBS 116435 TaxID=1314669 RepID=A0A9P4URR8_9PEZI|nr:MFS monocarboxylate transporter-like protein [Polychaeton citri CBS 116435]